MSFSGKFNFLQCDTKQKIEVSIDGFKLAPKKTGSKYTQPVFECLYL